MNLFFTYFEKPHICVRLTNKESTVADEINDKLMVAPERKDSKFLVKDRELLLKEIMVKKTDTIVQIDIRSFFYSVDHQILLKQLEAIAPSVILTLKRFFSELNSKMQEKEFAIAKSIKNNCGLVLGHEMFFRLANIYLQEFDQILDGSLIVSRYYRFIDDLLILTDSPDEVVWMVESELNKLELVMNYEKLIVSPPGQPFSYLKQVFSTSD